MEFFDNLSLADIQRFENLFNRELVRVRVEENQLFGKRQELENDEHEIVFDMKIPHEAKLTRLRAIRKEKGVAKRKASIAAKKILERTFEQRITSDDALRARALGIRLS